MYTTYMREIKIGINNINLKYTWKVFTITRWNQCVSIVFPHSGSLPPGEHHVVGETRQNRRQKTDVLQNLQHKQQQTRNATLAAAPTITKLVWLQ